MILLTQITNFLQDIKNPRITFNDNLQKVMFRQESKYAIMSFIDYSVLQLLGLLELSLLGDTQAASLGFLPIQSKFGYQA